MDNHAGTLGHFLNFELWQEAIKLLNFQIAAQETNKHFKTLSMIHYKRLGNTVHLLSDPEYFSSKIANNLFYGLQDEFAIYPYVIPKSGLGLRNYKFLSYPLRVLYYAISLYLLKISDEYLKNFYAKRSNIHSYYGGGLHFDNNHLVVTKNSIYFAEYYKKFRNQIRREISQLKENRIVIRLDIQNYYDEISLPILLNSISRACKLSQLSSMSFDEDTKEQITFFFRYLAQDGLGIPQSDNIIMSSFLGYLYLVFGDLLIETELFKFDEIVEGYKIIRFVDDIFISIQFKSHCNRRMQDEFAEAFGSRVADILYYRLGLKLNAKTRFFWLNDDSHLNELKASLKKVSPEYHISDENGDETPNTKVENIFDELTKLKNSSIEAETFTHELKEEILKEVFDRSVFHLLETPVNIAKIRGIFTDFDFNLVKQYPLSIIIVILKDQESTEKFREFLLRTSDLTTRDIDLILTFLCQIDFHDQQIANKLKQYEPLKAIIEFVDRTSLMIEKPGYFHLQQVQVMKIAKMPNVIEQICHRVFNENCLSYSVALNHLLNEIHAICYELDSNSNHGDYNANRVVDFLNSSRVSPQISTSIRNLFDRRNVNPISHPGSKQRLVASASQKEYEEYRMQVGNCLSVLLR